MKTLAEIEIAVSIPPPPTQEELFAFLAARLRRAGRVQPLSDSLDPAVTGHGILDIAPAQVGNGLRPFSPDDDLLGEMLAGRW